MIIVQVSNFIEFKRTFPIAITKFCLVKFYVISPNSTRYTTKLEKKFHRSIKTEAVVWPGGGGEVLPYINYISMCRPKEHSF